jgi:choline dehydrogenase
MTISTPQALVLSSITYYPALWLTPTASPFPVAPMGPRLVVVVSATLLFTAHAFVFAAHTSQQPLSNHATNGVSRNPWDAASKTFDYIVVGGGLTGITVAARLAEDPTKSILVIEAGQDNRSDQRVQDIYTYGQAFGSTLDWRWPMDHGRNITG